MENVGRVLPKEISLFVDLSASSPNRSATQIKELEPLLKLSISIRFQMSSSLSAYHSVNVFEWKPNKTASNDQTVCDVSLTHSLTHRYEFRILVKWESSVWFGAEPVEELESLLVDGYFHYRVILINQLSRECYDFKWYMSDIGYPHIRAHL